MKSFRLVIIILVLLCLGLGIFAAVSFTGLQKANSERLTTENTLNSLKDEKAALDKELSEQKKTKLDLEAQLADMKGKVSALQDKAEKLAAMLADEKKAREDAEDQLSSKSRELDDVKTNWESEKISRTSLQEQYDKIFKEFSSLQDQLKAVSSDNDNLRKQVEDLQAKKEVELDKIVVKPGVDAEGKVLVVNKEFNFIVVAAGNNKGISPGVVFGVFRDGKLIAKAQVEKVYETMSAANITEGTDIREGDIAKAM
jgi:TolA-binding protein